MANILFPEQLSYLESFRKDRDDLLFKMERFAKENKIPIIEKSAAEFLEQLVYIYRPKMFLEIGTAIGYSAIRVAKTLKKQSVVHTIELSKNNIRRANSFIKSANLADVIKILEGNAIDILPSLEKKYDFIFLDADKEDYMELFDLAMKLLKLGGIILVDNLLWKGYVATTEIPEGYKKSTEFIRKFNAKFLEYPNLRANILPIGDGLGLGIKIA
jgi:predicted O-methyltransferase YrrM